MKAWFTINKLQKKVGEIIDRFGNYIELKEVEGGEFYIRHINEIQIIR